LGLVVPMTSYADSITNTNTINGVTTTTNNPYQTNTAGAQTPATISNSSTSTNGSAVQGTATNGTSTNGTSTNGTNSTGTGGTAHGGTAVGGTGVAGTGFGSYTNCGSVVIIGSTVIHTAGTSCTNTQNNTNTITRP
jgi:hypothetical protein